MHASVLKWIKEQVRNYGLKGDKVLEVGSYNENGSVRKYFTGEYVGVDMRKGKGVDIVANAHNLPFGDETFDVVISTEMLEHDSHFWVSLSEMGRVLRLDGLLFVTARGNGFPEHAYPSDYYRFMPGSMKTLIKLAGCEPLQLLKDPEAPGIFISGIKKHSFASR